MKTKNLLTLSVIALGTVFAASAQAGGWSAGVVVSGPVYRPAPVVVTAPPVCAPPVVVYAPPPAVCYPARPVCPPVVVVPPHRVWGRHDCDRCKVRYGWHRNDRDGCRDHRHSYYRHDRYDYRDRDDRNPRGPGHR